MQPGSRDLHMQTGCIFQRRVSILEHKRTDCDKIQAPQRVNMDARYTRVYCTGRANPEKKWGYLATLAREMHVS